MKLVVVLGLGIVCGLFVPPKGRARGGLWLAGGLMLLVVGAIAVFLGRAADIPGLLLLEESVKEEIWLLPTVASGYVALVGALVAQIRALRLSQ